MTNPRRKFSRPTGERRYKKLFLISTEGQLTEPDYFSFFNHTNSVVKVNCLKNGSKSSPQKVLQRLTENIQKEGLLASDEAWVVIDKDMWTEEQINKIVEWTKESGNFNLALSNPNFEYWLLLHFEDGNGINSSRVCVDRLKQYLPKYAKGVEVRKLSYEMIQIAVKRAKAKNNPVTLDWPRSFGQTTVYRLVENILNVQ
jgi:hypothetical protein